MPAASPEERLAALHRLEADAAALAAAIDREIPPWDDADPRRPDPLRDARRSQMAALRAIRDAIGPAAAPITLNPRFPVEERKP